MLHDSFVFAVVANCLMRLRYLSDFRLWNLRLETFAWDLSLM